MASEFLIEDAVIWTSSRPSPQPGYMAVCDGVIAAIGSGQSPDSPKRRALGARHVLPGFVDAHSHLTVSAWLPRALGADFDQWSGGLPRPDDLDAAAGGLPTVIADFSLHRCLASHEARRLGGVARAGASSQHSPHCNISTWPMTAVGRHNPKNSA